MKKGKNTSQPPQTPAAVEALADSDRLLNIDNHYALKQQLRATASDPAARQWLLANKSLWKKQ